MLVCQLCNGECVCASADVRAFAIPGVQRDEHCRLQQVLHEGGVASFQVKSVLSVSLLDTINLNLYDKMQVDQTASADTLMVLLTLLSLAEVLSNSRLRPRPRV